MHRFILSILTLMLATPGGAGAAALPGWPVVVGHRGMGKSHVGNPENSLPALVEALDKGMSAVEFDVQLSRDGEVVLAHDVRLERVTDGFGCVSDRSLAELRKLRLRDGAGIPHPETGMPTLRETLRALRALDGPWRPFLADIHVKVYDGFHGDLSGWNNGGCPRTHWRELADQVVAIVHDLGLDDRVIFTCFDHRTLDYLGARHPGLHTGLLSLIGPRHAIRRAAGHYEFAVLSIGGLDPGDVALARRKGLRLLVWSPDTRESLDRSLLDFRVDGVISDRLELALDAQCRAVATVPDSCAKL